MWHVNQILTLDVGPDSVSGLSLPCGKDSDNLSTTSSPADIHCPPNPYVGEFGFSCPYMGVSFFAVLQVFQDFST
jgi:hypothetical protein